MWENETEQDNTQDKKTKKINFLPPQPVKDGDGILMIQAVICVIIIIFVLFTRAVGTGFFEELKIQYKQLFTQGVDLSEQGELVRFVDGVILDIRLQAQQILNNIDETKGASGGMNTTTSYQVSEAPYMVTVKAQAPLSGDISSSFGKRTNPVTGKSEIHAGMDIPAIENQHVLSAYGGTVVKTGENNIRGKYVIVQHSNTLQTLYQHLNAIYVNENAKVLRGQIIAGVGSTGLSTGPHLHFEVLVNNISVNPITALR